MSTPVEPIQYGRPVRFALAIVVGLAGVGCGAAHRGPVDGMALARVWGGAGEPRSERWPIGRTSSARLSPDGAWAIADLGGAIALIAVPSGAYVAMVAVQSFTISHSNLAFSPDSRRFAVVDTSRHCVAIWNVAPAREQACLAATDDSIVAFSPDGTSLAIADSEGRLARWSLATRAVVWSVQVHPAEAEDQRLLAWPTPDVILVASQGLVARDAGDGHARWASMDRVEKYLGVFGGDAVVIGQGFDAPGAGPIARFALATGKLRDLTGGAVRASDAALLDDGTVAVIDDLNIVHRFALAGDEINTYALAEHTDVVATQPGGHVALTVGYQGIVLWDLRAGKPLDVADGQPSPILALDADAHRVVSAAADGSVVVRGRDGTLLARRHARTTWCLEWAVSAPANLAVCAAQITGHSGLAAYEPSTHEWLALDRDDRGAGAWGGGGGSLAVDDHGRAWVSYGGGARWFDLNTRPDGRFAPPTTSSELDVHDDDPRVARIVSGGQAVAYGRAQYAAAVHGEWAGWQSPGLTVITRDGAKTVLDPQLHVVGLGTDRTGDLLAVVDFGRIELWRRTGGPASWARQWSVASASHVFWRRQLSAGYPVAISSDGALVASGEFSNVTLYAAATGAVLATVDIAPAAPGSERYVSSLVFAGDALYAGTTTGLVLVLALHHGPPPR